VEIHGGRPSVRLYRLKREAIAGALESLLDQFSRFWWRTSNCASQTVPTQGPKQVRPKGEGKGPVATTGPKREKHHKGEKHNEKIKVDQRLRGDDQSKALRFYTAVLGFAKEDRFQSGHIGWLTVVSHEETKTATALQLALNNNPRPQNVSGRSMSNRASPPHNSLHRTDRVQGGHARNQGPRRRVSMQTSGNVVGPAPHATAANTCGTSSGSPQLKRM